jgi:ethanolamine phosphate transferase 2 subunit G
LNIAESDTSSTLLGQDSWLAQMHRQGRQIHMFGDDTWIKLFPGLFHVSEGTASFFVSDYTEVDNNVTRHLKDELRAPVPWDVLILHYLGLDHIGHKSGPESPFMAGKQKEMDDIIRRVYNSVDEKTLMVVVGDHGMNEAGNHGGSSAGETSAALAFLSKGLELSEYEQSDRLPLPISPDYNYIRRVQQSDLVPSLAALMGFPIPKNSLGIVLPELLSLWKDSDAKDVLAQNVYQISNILDSSFPWTAEISCEDFDILNNVQKAHCLRDKIVGDRFSDISDIYEFLEQIQSTLAKASSNYNTNDLIFGTVILLMASIMSSFIALSLKLRRSVRFLLVFISSLYVLLMFGSSLVEEEHHFWYWMATGTVVWLYIVAARKKFRDGVNWIICLALVRLIRAWNQTGQKYAGGPDVAKALASDQYSSLLWVLIIIHYGSLIEKLWKGTLIDLPPMAGFTFSFTTIVSSLCFKVNMAIESGESIPGVLQILKMSSNDPINLIRLAQLSFFCTFSCGLYEFSKFFFPSDVPNRTPLTDLSYVFEVFLITMTRTCNIPLFIFFNLLRTNTSKAFRGFYPNKLDTVVLISIFTLILQQFSFFAFGNSNSLASIDLSNAYNGVNGYNVVIVGVLTFVGNWIGPLYWSVVGTCMLLETPEILLGKKADTLAIKIKVSQMFFSVGTLGILLSCFLLRHHLFIWTVFSPKLLYAASWLVLQHFIIDIVMTVLLSYAISK